MCGFSTQCIDRVYRVNEITIEESFIYGLIFIVAYDIFFFEERERKGVLGGFDFSFRLRRVCATYYPSQPSQPPSTLPNPPCFSVAHALI